MGTVTFTMRPPRDSDIPRLIQLDRAAAEEAGIVPGKADEDEYRLMWSRPRFDRERHARVVEADGPIVASAGFGTDGDGEGWGGGWVLPSHRRRGIGTALVRWLIDTARAEGTVRELYTGADEERTEALELIESFGFAYERTFHRMLNPDPAACAEPLWPEGIGLRPLEGDALIEAAVKAHDESFVDHWNFTPARSDEWAHWTQHPDWDPTLCYFAYHGDELAGFCVNWINRGDEVVRGDLGPIGTTRPFRGIGLGRALLRHSVRQMAARGATEVVLGVDSQNPNGALGLYERNGFRRSRTTQAYLMKL